MDRSRLKILDILLPIVIAIGLWSYVINVVNPPQTVTIRDVPIQILGLEALQSTRLTIAGDGEYTCDVSVKGARSDITGLTADDIYASVNLTGLSAGQNNVNVSVTAPANITIEDVRSQKIQVYVDELVTEQKPINVVHADIDGDYEVTITSQEADNLLVTGAKSLVSMITEIRVDLDVNALAVDDSTTLRIAGKPLDSEGNLVKNVKLSRDQIYITASIYQLYDVRLDVNYDGTPGLGAQLSRVDLPATLRVKGRGSVIRSVKAISTDTIDIDGITDDLTVDVVYHLPENVYLAEDAEQPVASFTLIHTGEISFTYGKDEILVKNVPEDCLEYSLAEDTLVTVTAKGDLSVIRTIEAKDLQPSVDLSELVTGENRMELSSSFVSAKVTVRIKPSMVTVNAVMEEEELPPEPSEPAEGQTAQEPEPPKQ